MNRSRRLLAAAFTVVAVLGAVAFASAASLPVAPGVMTSRTAERPCDNDATATAPAGSGPTYTAVSLTVPLNCVNRSVQVTLVDGGGVAHSSVSTVMASATQDVAVSSYTAAAGLTVGATVDGWNLTTTWSYTPPSPLPAVSCRIINHPSATCRFDITYFTAWAEPWPGVNKFEINGNVVGLDNANKQEWELTFNFTDSQFPFVPRGLQSNGGLVVEGSQCQPLVVRGNPDWAGSGDLGYDQIRLGQTRAVYLQGYLNTTGNLLNCP